MEILRINTELEQYMSEDMNLSYRVVMAKQPCHLVGEEHFRSSKPANLFYICVLAD